jgi:hypothetical protein
MNAKKRVAICMMCLFLLSISTASAYIEPRTPYIIESSAEGITEDENGNIIITDHGCLFQVNTTFHYRYGFENIDSILAVIKNPAGDSLDFEYMDLNQTSTKEGTAKVWLEIPGENRTAGTYTIKYVIEGDFDKMFLSSTANFVIEHIEEEEEKTEIKNIETENSSTSSLQHEETELNLVSPSQDQEDIQNNEETIATQEENYNISPVFFAVTAIIVVAIFLRKED